ncbi:hypothetical protein [Actinomycetospora aeridis]|uniref:Uncharacterized protein n=1 Tax=Actinomycetospora aeridis TaxID=3129231 RepID=A0ABU8NES2_9PSEU
MEGSARRSAIQGLSASAILEVAEGLRWTDPQLSVALAEHVARSAGEDAGARSAAERSAVLALGQSDRAAALILRAVPQLEDADRAGRSADAAVLRCELALAAVRCDELDAAEALLGPLAAGQVLDTGVRADALVAWAAARAARGDVAGVDAAARQVDDLVGKPSDDVRRLAVQRSRSRARRVIGDATDALAVLRNATIGEAVVDGGRETALIVADQVELLAELGRVAEARELGGPLLAATPQATTALAVGRVRCVLARLVSLADGDVDTAGRLAREAEADLVARGHEAQAAEAVEVLAEVAAHRGDSRHALDELRRAHGYASSAREETTRARIALAVALSRTQHSAPADGSPPAVVEPVDTGRRHPDPSPDSAPPVVLPDGGGPSLDSLGVAPDAPGLGASTGDGTGSAQGEAPVRGSASESAAEGAEETAPEVRPGRRRARYRDNADPGEALAAALAAARGGSLDPFAAPASATPMPEGGSSDDEPSAASTGLEAIEWSDTAPDTDTDPGSDARSRRLARARARWETGESWLSRRPGTPGDDAAATEGADQPDHRGGRRRVGPGVGDDAERRTDRHRRRDEQRSEDRVPDPLTAAGPARRDADGAGETEGATRRRAGREDDQPLGRNGDHPPSRNGHGAVGGGRVVRDAVPDADGGGSTGPRSPWPYGGAQDSGYGSVLENGRPHRDPSAGTSAVVGDRAPHGRDGRDGEPVTIAARWGDALRDGRPAVPTSPSVSSAPDGVDDEYRRELALTLVDLLSEYQDAAPPTAAAPSTTPPTPPTMTTPPPPDGRAPSGATSAPETRRGGRPAARGPRNGVPSARRADDSGPRLADLLADAMDAYHSAEPAADDRRARR